MKSMSKKCINTSNLFSSAPGWRCFYCTIMDDDQPVFGEQPVLGWGVIEEGYPEENTELDLLVAIKNKAGRPIVHCAYNLLSWDSDFYSSFIFLFNSELSEEDKRHLEENARDRMTTTREVCSIS